MLRRAAEVAFREERRAEMMPFIDEDKACEFTDTALQAFLQEIETLAHGFMRRAGGVGAALEAADQRMNLRHHLEHYLRQHRSGFFDTEEPQHLHSTINNSLHVETAIGSAIQQGAHGSTIQLKNSVDFASAAQAAQALISELEKVANTPEAEDLRADALTATQQLKKASPSTLILREVGSSVRNIAEGVVGGALAPPVVAAALALASALGAGG